MFTVEVDKIKWIAGSLGMSIDTLAEEIAPKKKEDFKEGKLGKGAIQKLAKVSKQPLAFLLHDLPLSDQKIEFPDFRQTATPIELSSNFFEILKDVRKKVDWYEDFLKEEGYEPLSFIGKYNFNLKLSVTTVVEDIIRELKWVPEYPIKTDLLLNNLINAVEESRILVFRNSIVKNNTRAPLSVDEFRGFVISNQYAPAIFINTRDSKAANLFTLVHELAHLWLGLEGVSNIDYEYLINIQKPSREVLIERFCNKVTAEFLMPHKIFKQKWNNSNEPKHEAYNIANYFGVSALAAAIRANELKLLDRVYVSKIQHETTLALQRKKERASSGGPKYIYMIPIRNSRRFTNTVVRSAMNQKITLKYAGQLINASPKVVMDIYKGQV